MSKQRTPLPPEAIEIFKQATDEMLQNTKLGPPAVLCDWERSILGLVRKEIERVQTSPHLGDVEQLAWPVAIALLDRLMGKKP